MKIIDREVCEMNAIEFVKKFGLDKAREIVNDVIKFKDYRKPTHWDSDLNIYHDFKVLDESDVSIADLKQIVNAFEILKYFGGIDNAKYNLTNACISASELLDLKTSIELVEKCK